MQPRLCQSGLGLLLKFFNFLQTFVGVSFLIYSVWVLNGWRRRGLPLDLDGLPAPWFVCASMAVGVLVCLIAFTGYVATEAVSRCCLCFYAILCSTFIALEAALVSGLVLCKNWQKDLPYDTTGELKRLQAFIEENLDVMKWVAASVIVIQALSLLLAVLLRAVIPSRRLDYDSDEDFVIIRRPLLYPQSNLPYIAPSFESRPFHSDIWSSRLREQHGLNQNEYSYNVMQPKTAM